MNISMRFAIGFILLFPVFWGLGEIFSKQSCPAAVAAELFGTVVIAMLAAVLLSRSDEGKAEPRELDSNNPYEFITGRAGKMLTATKSLELAADNIKQFLTLTTAMLAVTSAMVVANQYIEKSPWYVKSCFFYAWACQAGSIYYGVWGHMKVIGLVHFIERNVAGDVYDEFLTYCMQKQQIYFGLGLLFTVICAVFVMFSPHVSTTADNQGNAFSMLRESTPH